MIKKNSLLYNTIVFGLGSLGTKAIQFLLIPLMTAFMNPTEFGRVDYYNALIMLMVPILSLSIADGIIRFGIQSSEKRKKKLINSIFSLFVCFSIVLFFFPILLMFFKYKLYSFLVIYLLAQIINQIILSFLKVLEMNLAYSLSGFFSALFQMSMLLVIFRLYSHSVGTYFLTCSVALMLVNGFLLILVNPTISKIDFTTIFNILKYSIPLIPNVLLWWVMNFSDRFFIKTFLGFTSSGYYSLATKVPILINAVMTIFLQAWQLELFKITEKKKLTNLINKASSLFNYFNYVLVAFLIPIIPFIVSLLANDNYSVAKNYVPLLLLGSIYSNLSMFIGTNYLVDKTTNKLWLTATVGAILNIILNIVLIPILGINGASLSTLISYFAVYVVRYVDQKKRFELRLDWINIILINIMIIIQVSSFFFFNKLILTVVSLVTILLIVIISIHSLYDFNSIRNN